MFSSAKQVSDDLRECVYQVADNDTGGHDLSVRVLLLIEVPSTSHPQELAIVTSSVQNEDHYVQDLEKIRNKC